MKTDLTSAEVLVSAAEGIGAAAVVDALAEHGIRAQAVGGSSSASDAEAPAVVKIVLERGDLARAAELLAEIDCWMVETGDASPRPYRRRRCRADLLPQGDRYDRPPGRRQFTLKSLFWLLTISAVVAAAGRLTHLGPIELIILLLLTIVVWWKYAEIRDKPPAEPLADQETLREEVKQWTGQHRGR
jgi:hypothetical protein